MIGESLDRLGRANRFTQLDLTSAYHRMRIRESEEWKTAFQTRYGHFEYQVMPFSPSNAPASFQEYINKLLAEKLNIFVIVYLDDILIYTEDPSPPHVEAARWILEQLRKHGLFANLKKCQFQQDEVRFLSFIVSAHRIKMEEERIEAVSTWPEPKSIRDIQVFLGFANFYRRFIKNFSRIDTPLTSILRTTSQLSDACSLSIRANDNNYNQEVGGGSGGAGAAGKKVKNPSKAEKSKISAKSKKLAKAKKLNTDFTKAKANEASGTDFLTSEARETFIRLRKAFTEAPILHHFDLESHIQIETVLPATALVQSLVSRLCTYVIPITWLQRILIRISNSLSPKLANGTQWPFSLERWFL